MSRITLDRPWRRPGAFAYARTRIPAALRPPVTVYPMPAGVTKDEDVPVRMSDGVTLRLNLFRPAGDGPFPVIMSAHPYGKDQVPTMKRGRWSLNPQFRIMNQPEPLRISDQTSWEAPDPVWWAQQGYAVINLDTRGGGHSEGRGDLLSDQEADDIAQVIAWAAEQPWSTGRVGMLGVSYLALSQYKVAALDPPALKAICPWEGFTDAYRDFFTPGGVVENGFARVWLFLTSRVARLNHQLRRRTPQAPPPRRMVGGHHARRVEDQGPDPGVHQLLRRQPPQRRIDAGLPALRLRRPPRLRAPRAEVGHLLRRGSTPDPACVLRPAPARPGRRPVAAHAAGDPGPARPHRRSPGRAGMAAGTHRLASAPPRRRRHLERAPGRCGPRHLRPATHRRRLRLPLRRGHRAQRPHDPPAPRSHHRREGPEALRRRREMVTRRPGLLQRLLRVRTRPRRPRPAPPRPARARPGTQLHPTSPNTPSAPSSRFATTRRSRS